MNWGLKRTENQKGPIYIPTLFFALQDTAVAEMNPNSAYEKLKPNQHAEDPDRTNNYDQNSVSNQF